TCVRPGCWECDPCTCKSPYCPGPMVTYKCEQPGRWVCKKVWCPREEIRTQRCCQYVPREQWHTETCTVCKTVPYTVMKQVPYTTCRQVREDHCKMVTCKKCTMVPEVC